VGAANDLTLLKAAECEIENPSNQRSKMLKCWNAEG
jgi:hypothetical protein